MPASIGVNLRVTGHCRQGGRKYMEDFFSVAYQQTEDEKDLEYAFFGIYDGHGGAEAAAFAKEHLMETIIKHKNFWSDDDEDVLRAIKDGYIATHYAMWREQEKWPRTASGLPSTAGTTASIAFIRRGKIYIGHVGDSGIILGYQEPGCSEWKAKPLTRDHKPENLDEMSRIKSCGGKVVSKSGVPRVVWNRPKIGHQGPVRRSTPIDEIPFLAVARSLGDLWSYNYQSNRFIVSPDPDCSVIKIDTNTHRCLVFGTDGLYNMLNPSMAVHIVQQVERHNENAALSDSTYKTWLNPSKLLVEKALERWHLTKMRADNTSVVTLMLDPPGPPRAQVLKDRKKNLPERGLKIMTRFDGGSTQESSCSSNCDSSPIDNHPLEDVASSNTILESVPDPTPILHQLQHPSNPLPQHNKDECLPVTSLPIESTSVSSSDLTSTMTNFPLKERNFLPKPRESTSFDPREPWVSDSGKENCKSQAQDKEDNTIQCNEVSSSNLEVDSTCLEDEEEDNFQRNGKHNLRSGKKTKGETASSGTKVKHNGEGESKSTGVKRKLEIDLNSQNQPRKSLRIDNNQKRVEENTGKERKAYEAEEKLKKLAEMADLAKRKATTSSLPSPAQILKAKNVEMKKKSGVLNKPIAKRNIKLVFEKVKKVQTLSKASSIKGQKLQSAAKTPLKIVAKKATFQRHSKKNSSQRQRNVTVTVGNVTDKQSIIKVKPNLKENINIKAKSLLAGKKESPAKVVKSASSNIAEASKISLRNSGMLNLLGTSSRSTKNSCPVKTPHQKFESKFNTKTLKKKIQQKTESIKRNVMRKK
uniref:Protein phosphatase 1D n=1 Tax=Diabrotica virgifera virgifera TaxID=50390 RepID=A0A6P7GT77_DIAVI